MNCTECGFETKVIDSRMSLKRYLRRRRECLKCSHRFTTYEAHEKDLIIRDCKICGSPTYKKHRLCYTHYREYQNKKGAQYKKIDTLKIKMKGVK